MRIIFLISTILLYSLNFNLAYADDAYQVTLTSIDQNVVFKCKLRDEFCDYSFSLQNLDKQISVRVVYDGLNFKTYFSTKDYPLYVSESGAAYYAYSTDIEASQKIDLFLPHPDVIGKKADILSAPVLRGQPHRLASLTMSISLPTVRKSISKDAPI
ncbi:MAG: hypothetical protein VYC19_06415 [Pseudomonadota bacterium]|nr:hypothetical protein [Pseudomonadota bacterium]